MKKRNLILIIGFLITQLSFAQKQQKFYYDSEWKGTSKSNAEFYRIFKTNENGDPIGEVKDYFITGELQSRIDGASYIDKYDDSKSIFIGFSKGFFKSGDRAFEHSHDGNGNILSSKTWYKNGNIGFEASYNKDGAYDGLCKIYYESGKLHRQLKFKNGKLENKFFIECDEFNKCQNIFYESFDFSENTNEWPLETGKDLNSQIIANEGLLVETQSEGTFQQTLNIPLNLTNNFSIEAIIDFKSGDTNNGQGLIWGFKDWDNFFYFYISTNGYYKIGAKTEGITFDVTKWKKSSTINPNYKHNQLKILRVADKIYYSINGSIVETTDFYAFRGNYIGFSLIGKQKVLFKNLIVKQDISDFQNKVINESSSWKGNGTGFFIDKKGYIATNYHVIENASEIEIEFVRNGVKQIFPAKIIQSDRQNDISIIKITSSDFNPFTKLPYNFRSNISDVGSNVFALGYPLALSLMGTEIKFTDGKISSKTGIQGDITSYQISVPIQPGNSGGPLFDFDGNLIGITSSGINRKLDITENVNYAIKSSYLKNLIDVLDYKLTLPNDTYISNMTLTEKIKKLSDYVVLIKIK